MRINRICWEKVLAGLLMGIGLLRAAIAQEKALHNYGKREEHASGRTVGSPLMFAFEDRKQRLIGGVENNRVVAHHLGLAGRLGQAFRYRLVATYSRNYGTYNGRDVLQQPGATYRFEPPPEQLSWLVVLDWEPVGQRLAVQVAVGGDVGELYSNNLGIGLGVRYRPYAMTSSAKSLHLRRQHEAGSCR
ncbi:hypothetical protein [Rhodothermus profundi]|uniref:hypothetical protein n=1 Tax=Rhodothermus profundi TaxID=633813 RepID=UPI000A567B78|nr:hypothetical protein [Rhodothermus profundi]